MALRIIPDTSIIIDGKLSKMLEKGELKDVELIVPVAVLDELQAQASKGKEQGFIGLDELKKLRKICEEKKIRLKFSGERPTLEDIKLARSGRMDALIRDVAKREGGVLFTADFVQALVSEAEGVETKYFPSEVRAVELGFEKFFTPDTLSLHLKEGVSPLAKRGIPGKFKLVKVREEPCTAEELERMIREISDYVRADGESSIEINRAGAIIAQLRDYRVAIARPPFSDGLEVTVVRPIVKLTLEDYRLSKRLMDRLKSRAEGILIAGPPGSGKTTLASSLAEFYKVQGKIVKTLESPRDLQVGPDITQYGPLEGSFEKTADILLMVRPDYSIFDEVRKTSDFQIFVDMRLAGVGMVGVVHASDAIDAIQRFMGRVELGMVPHVIDTIMFVKDGEVKKVYELKLTVKVPTGMTEEDLARPVVEVRDFETGRIEYEIYTFGEENVVIPVEEAKPSPLKRLAEERVLQEVRRFDAGAEAEIVSENRAVVRVSNKAIPKLIGKNGSTISSLEKKLGIRIEVEPKVPSLGKEAKFELKDAGSALEIKLGKRRAGRIANFYVDGEFLFSATIGKKGAVKVAKDSEAGGKLLKAILEKKEIKVFI